MLTESKTCLFGSHLDNDEDLQDAVRDLPRGARAEADMDMTPMVDVTFLLLIFFMVTASFTLQKSLAAPRQEDHPSTATQRLAEFTDNPECIVVRVDEYDTYQVSFAGWERDQEAPSQHELIRWLRRARERDQKPNRLVIAAHGDAKYDTVMKAWDAGTQVGMEQIQPLLAEESL